MTRYEFHGDRILELNRDGEIFFVDLEHKEIVTEKDDVICLFENEGMGEKNPLLTDEEIEEKYGLK